MSLVEVPLSRVSSSQLLSVDLTVRLMNVCQHVMAAALTTVGAVRAVLDGVPVLVAIVSGLALVSWHTAGSQLPARYLSTRFAAVWLVGFALIWLVTVAISAEFVSVAFLLWLLAGHLLPVRWGLVFSALVLGVVILTPILHDGSTSYANIFGPTIGGVFAFGVSLGYLQLLRDAVTREELVASLTKAQAEMSELHDELARTQRHSGMIAERTRISRDIHDTVAQALSSIKLLTHVGSKRTEDRDAARTLSQVESMASESLADVRRIVAALVPAQLEDGALAVALQRMCTRLSDEHGIDVVLQVDHSLPVLPTNVEVALLRTAQSALANVRQHAEATHVVMSVIDAVDAVRLDLVDDGRGFDIAEWEQSSGHRSVNFGLGFMRDRLRELGGELDIESAPGRGTAISASLPIHLPSKAVDVEVIP